MTAKEYAIKCHRDTNHKYGEEDYEIHLAMVYETGKKFIHLIPKESQQDVLDSLWCHDVVEDCRQTYNDVLNATNFTVAEIVYALSNEKGKNRKERANQKYYQGILDTPYAVFAKLCDRIANYQYSIENKSRMVELYEKEMSDFINQIYDSKYDEMFEYLKKLKN